MQSHKTILSRFLESDDRPEGTLGYHQLQGFLFTICCSPALITPSEWMPLIFNEQEAGYRDEAEAETIVAAILALYKGLSTGSVPHKLLIRYNKVLEKQLNRGLNTIFYG